MVDLSDIGRSNIYDIGRDTIAGLQRRRRLEAELPGIEARSDLEIAKLRTFEEAQAQQERIKNTRIPIERLPGFMQMGGSQQQFMLTMMKNSGMMDDNNAVAYGDYQSLSESIVDSFDDGKKFIQMGIADTRNKIGILNTAIQTQDKSQQKQIFGQFNISKPEEAQGLLNQLGQQLTMQVNNASSFEDMHKDWRDLPKNIKSVAIKHGVSGPAKWGTAIATNDPILRQIGSEVTRMEAASKKTRRKSQEAQLVDALVAEGMTRKDAILEAKRQLSKAGAKGKYEVFEELFPSQSGGMEEESNIFGF